MNSKPPPANAMGSGPVSSIHPSSFILHHFTARIASAAAPSPATTDPATYASAAPTRSSRINSSASTLNVEKVVNPPQKPVPSRTYHSRRAGSAGPRHVAARNPSSADPDTLMTNVPHGNPTPP